MKQLTSSATFCEIAAMFLGSMLALPLAIANSGWFEVPFAQMDVTEGRNDTKPLASGLIEIRGARFRATESGVNSHAAQLGFAYRGKTLESEPTQGGDERIQIGEKMLAANPCNLVYVMWRLYPVETLVVSVKRYPGTTSAQCQNHGYTNIVPNLFPVDARSANIPVPQQLTARTGAARMLRSDIDPLTKRLSVRVNGQLLWQGYLPDSLVRDLTGPSGVRSDNGVFRFRLYTKK